MAEVIGLRGTAVPGNPEPDENVVETLERYLALAKDGQVRGIVFGIIDVAGYYTTGWNGDADGQLMLSAAAMLSFRVAKWLDED